MPWKRSVHTDQYCGQQPRGVQYRREQVPAGGQGELSVPSDVRSVHWDTCAI
jgi:hypothetical protein